MNAMILWKRICETARPVTLVHNDIDEELRFHFESLVADFQSDGMTHEEATDHAIAEFGLIEHYKQECRDIAAGNRWLVGTGTMLTGAGAVAALLCLSLVFARLCANQRSQIAKLESQIHALDSQLAMAPVKHTATTIKGSVADADGHPIREAAVMVVVKTWPGGMYSQVHFAATTDVNGRFVLRDKLPEFGDYAIQVSVAKSGMAFQSQYRVESGPDHHGSPNQQFDFRLAQSSVRQMELLDHNSQPIVGATVTPHQRAAADGSQHVVYMQAAEPVQLETDERGRVQLAAFQVGDGAEVVVQLDDGRSHSLRFQVDDELHKSFRLDTRASLVLQSGG